MLAEPRRKQKLSIDPQNVGWRNGDSVGKKLLQRMGWKDGAGIGRNEQGTAENVKLKPNFTSSGLGADKKAAEQEQWIAHHDDFATFLEQLNKNKGGDADTTTVEETRTVSIESASRSIKKRIHYKFTRGKDLSMASDQDKSAIFGRKKHRKNKNPEPVEETAVEVKLEVETDEEVVEKSERFTEKVVSSADHYAEKMKKWTKFFVKPSDVKKEEPAETDEALPAEETKEERKARKRARREERERLAKKQRLDAANDD